MFEKRNIFITGINGFVGGAVFEELQRTGRYEICGLVGSREALKSFDQVVRKNIFQADISDDRTVELAKELKKADVIIHSAGLAHQFGSVNKVNFWNVNVKGTENICHLAKKIGAEHFILISSVAVYGAPDDREIDETVVCNPKDVYADSKFEAEKRAVKFCEQNRIRLTILRLATVIGEGDRGNTARLITALDKGRFLWVGSGDNKKSLIYKGDVAKGILKTVESGGDPTIKVYNLVGENITIREIVEEISRYLQKKTPAIALPEGLVRGIIRVTRTGIKSKFLERCEKTFEKWLSNDAFSGAKFKARFNFTPETPIKEGLARQVNYYLKEKKDRKK